MEPIDLNNVLPTNALQQFEGLATSPDGKDYTCPTCGYIPAKLIKISKTERYIRQLCPCQKAARDERDRLEIERERQMHLARRTYNWLGERWSDASLMQKTFSNFDPLKQPGAYEAALLYIEIMKGSLVLYGTYGTGKTHLLAALCNQLLKERKKASLFTTAPKLFGAIQARIQAHEDYSRIITSAIAAPLFVIDDVDKAKHTDFREEIYFEIINERVNAGRPTALSTNKLDELADFMGGAVASRLKVGQVAIEMLGNDYREGMGA